MRMVIIHQINEARSSRTRRLSHANASTFIRPFSGRARRASFSAGHHPDGFFIPRQTGNPDQPQWRALSPAHYQERQTDSHQVGLPPHHPHANAQSASQPPKPKENLIDIFLVIIAALGDPVAQKTPLLNPFSERDVTVITDAGKPTMEMVVKKGEKIEHYSQRRDRRGRGREGRHRLGGRYVVFG